MIDQPASAEMSQRTAVLATDKQDVLATVQAVLAELMPHPAGSAAETFAPECEILDLGVSSVQMLQIHAHLETRLGREFPKTALFDYETIADLVDYLAGLPASDGPR